MNRRLWGLVAIIVWMAGCTAANIHREEIVYEDGKLKKYSYLDDQRGSAAAQQANSSVFLDAIDVIKRSDTTAFPDVQDLPLPQYNLKRWQATRSYTGIIQNHTRYDISIPSANSASTIIVPAWGWVEYTAWSPSINLQGFVDGKVIYHQKILAQPRKYQYKGKQYDFVAEIKPPAPKAVPKSKPKKKKVKSKDAC